MLYYYEFIEDKYHRFALLFYIASIFYHYAIIAVVLPRFALYLSKYFRSGKVTYILVILFAVFYTAILPLLNDSIFIQSVEEKLAGYQDYQVFGKWQYLNAMICIVLSTLLFLIARRDFTNTPVYIVVGMSVLLILYMQITEYQLVLREACLVSSLAVVPLASKIYDNKQWVIHVAYLQILWTFIYSFMHDYSIIEFGLSL